MNAADSKPLNVLLVDDDDDDSLMFSEALKDIPFPVSFQRLNDGEQFFQYLAKQACPDVIFLDLSLPGMTGKEVLKEIRTVKKFIDLPVIIYTGFDFHPDTDDLYNLGANLNIVKPTNYNDLVQVLTRVLSIDWRHNLPVTKREDFVVRARA